MILFLLIITWFVLVYVEAYINFRIISKKKKSPVHKYRTIIRFMFGGIWFFIFWKLEYVWYWLIFFQLFTFEFIFNTALNKLRNKRVYYLDDPKDKVEDSSWDTLQNKFINKDYRQLWWLFKGFLAVVFTSMIIFYGKLYFNQI